MQKLWTNSFCPGTDSNKPAWTAELTKRLAAGNSFASNICGQPGALVYYYQLTGQSRRPFPSG